MEFDYSKVLITGSSGMVGSYVDFGIKTKRRELDVTDLKNVRAQVEKYQPIAIIHLAAETDVDRCERDPSHAFLTNSVGTYNVATVAKEFGIKLIYISTAGVFDGEKESPYTKDDKPNPKNFYGHSKYLGEIAVKDILDNYATVRACWMTGGGPGKDKKFIAKIIEQIRAGKKDLKAVTDQIGAPTFGKDLISGVKKILEQDLRGTFHLSNTGKASRFDVAEEIVKILKVDVSVDPVDASFFNLDAKRTFNEMLEVEEGFMRPWQEALEEYITTEWIKK